MPGAEISCATGDPRVGLHLLAYLFDPWEPTLAAELAALREDRARRATAMVDRLRELGAPVEHAVVADLAGDGVVGRPHIARAMVDAGVVTHAAAAFTSEWIGDGGRAWVAKHALDPVEAIALVRNAGGVTVLAHAAAARRGAVVGDDVVAAMARAGLDGLEVDHPDHDDDDRQRLRELAATYDLLLTGSSDDHGTFTGDRIGCESTDPLQYEALLARAQVVP